MTPTAPSRRDRLRRETTTEIRSRAMALVVDNGPGALSLREIARQMGMTAGAIYGYFPTRDALVGALMDEVHEELMHAVETARDGAGTDPSARMVAWALAFREWSVGHPAAFRLVYGDAVPGYVPPEDGRARAADRRLCAGLAGLVDDLRRVPDDGSGSAVDPELLEASRDGHPDVGPQDVALALRAWGRMHGLVALEVYGHLARQTSAPAELYRAEIESLAEELRRS